MGVISSAEIRRQFIDFFKQRDHAFVPSSPVVPIDDPTLMFANAGMNQFKDIFLGRKSFPWKRATNSQKCIRVSGKHNDLEEVGKDTYHHTFFEMLGNWSFGDYFKAEAIEWAWDLLTDGWGIEPDRLWATVFGGDESVGLPPDEEAERLWPQHSSMPSERVLRFGLDANFWEMAETGPCGPNSEIFLDLGPDRGCRRPDCGPNCPACEEAHDDRFIELWNLVFIQFNRDQAGRLTELPARHVDTGMGFERLVAALQDKRSDYDTDVFLPLISRIGQITGKRYSGQLGNDVDNAFRVIADHVRMLTIAITDGVLPSNDGRGYVLRRILRRAARFGRQQLGKSGPFIHQLVPTVVEAMGEAFPELQRDPQRVIDVICEEEQSFSRTLEKGLQLFVQAAERASKQTGQISGEDAFKLYDTFGFPYDLTMQMGAERELTVDGRGFEVLLEEAKQRARRSAKKHATLAFDGCLPATDDSPKYLSRSCEGRLLGWVKANTLKREGQLSSADAEVGVVTDRTSFYAEQGGQVSDVGSITTATGTFQVDSTEKLGDGIVHVGHIVDGHIEIGQSACMDVDPQRDETRRNHTATHLMHWALREVLGEHVRQQGSLVEPERLRFDFDHPRPVTPEQIEQVEQIVNELIRADMPVEAHVLSTEEALRLPGVRAFFGEKYGDEVRVVEVGDGFSREFCGGTHLSRTGQAGFFTVLTEEGIAKGVRRITAATGQAAMDHLQRLKRTTRQAAEALRVAPEELPRRVTALQEEIRQLRKRLQKAAAADLGTVRRELLDSAERVSGHAVVIAEVPEAPTEQIRESIDWLRSEAGSAAVMLATRGEGKALLIAGITDDLVQQGISASDWVAAVAPVIDGRGGGRPQFAQAGGRLPDGTSDALDEARRWINKRL